MSNEELVTLIKNGTDRKENLYLLWNQNRGLIHIVISKYSSLVPYEDMLQNSFLALCDAVENYHQGEANFTTYFLFWLKRYCIHEIINNAPLSADSNVMSAVSKYRRMQSQYQSRFGELPTDEELRSLLRMNSATFERIKKTSEMLKTISADELIKGMEDDSITVIESIQDKTVDIESQILDKVTDEELHKEIEDTLSQLPDEQSQVLRMNYYDNLTMKTIAHDLGITETEARKRKDTAFRRIKKDRARYKKLYAYYEEKFPGAYKGGWRRYNHKGSVTENIAIDCIMEEIKLMRLQMERDSFIETR